LVPLPAFGHVFSGFDFIGVILVTAIPFGIYDLVEAMDNVERGGRGRQLPDHAC
jgi:AGZA family xanthine/uracil permease-like MFS transporter